MNAKHSQQTPGTEKRLPLISQSSKYKKKIQSHRSTLHPYWKVKKYNSEVHSCLWKQQLKIQSHPKVLLLDVLDLLITLYDLYLQIEFT